jgi:hypothetical protein
MVTRISAAAAIAMANAITALVDDGSVLRIYSGAMPASVDTALSGQTLLAEFPLASPDAFQDAVDTVNGAVATGNAVAAQDALATGVAAWGTVVNSSDVRVWDGDASLPAGTGAIKISSLNLTAGVEISVISLSYTQPKA